MVPVRNAASTVADTVSSLLAQDFHEPWELVVVDNGSTDGSPDVIERLLGGVEAPNLVRADVVLCTGPRGHATPRNHGASLTTGDILAFVDADDVCAPGWLSELVSATRSSGLAASNHVSLGGASAADPKIRSSVSVPGSKLGYPVATTAGLGVTRTLFDQLGGFDRRFETGGADADFSIRAARTGGVTPALAHGAIYYFRQQRSLLSSLRQGWRYGRSFARLSNHHQLRDDRASENWLVLVRLGAGILRRLPKLASASERSATASHMGWVAGRSWWSIKLMRRPF